MTQDSKFKTVYESIPNWMTWAVDEVTITLYEEIDDDEELYYRAGLLYHLIDGSEEEFIPGNDFKNVTFLTNIVSFSYVEAAYAAADLATNFCEDINDTVFVFDESNEIIKEFSLTEELDKLESV